MDDHIPRIRMARRARRLRRAAASARVLVVLTLLLGSASWTAEAASASTPAPSAPASGLAPPVDDVKALLAPRDRLPVVAGSELGMAGKRCTAGAVLYQSDRSARSTPELDATRYVVTAAHCGGVGTAVTVGGQYAGEVTYVSPRWDFSLITVKPDSRQLRHCSVSTSGVPSCYYLPVYTPRARGAIEKSGQGALYSAQVPVPGSGAPQGHEDFCASGNVSGWYCGFHTVANPPGLEVQGCDRTAQSFSGRIMRGDSGGPVSSTSGRIYGVIVATGPDGTRFRNDLYYLSIDTILRELPGYGFPKD
jgi:hypothetical protein